MSAAFVSVHLVRLSAGEQLGRLFTSDLVPSKNKGWLAGGGLCTGSPQRPAFHVA